MKNTKQVSNYLFVFVLRCIVDCVVHFFFSSRYRIKFVTAIHLFVLGPDIIFVFRFDWNQSSSNYQTEFSTLRFNFDWSIGSCCVHVGAMIEFPMPIPTCMCMAYRLWWCCAVYVCVCVWNCKFKLSKPHYL